MQHVGTFCGGCGNTLSWLAQRLVTVDGVTFHAWCWVMFLAPSTRDLLNRN